MPGLVLISFLMALPSSGPQSVAADLVLQSSGVKYELPAPMPNRVRLSSERPKEIRNAPDGSRLLWGQVQFGADPHGVTYNLVIDESDPLSARLYVDANANGDLLDDPPVEWRQVESDNPGSGRYEGGFHLPLSGPDADDSVHLIAYRYLAEPARRRHLSDDLLFYYRDYCATGTVVMNGRPHRVVVADEESLGSFLFPSSRRKRLSLGLDLDGDGRIMAGKEWFELHRPATLSQAGVYLKSISADGSRIEFITAAPGTRLATPFTGPGLDGKIVNFPDDYRGKLVLLDFWATWCGPCRTEVPNLVKVYRQFAGEQFDVLSISLDQAEKRREAERFIRESGMSWRHIFEGKGWASEVGRQYGVNAIPRVYLVDADSQAIIAEGAVLRGAQLSVTIARHLAGR